jgi:hypothetical protein
MTVEGCSSPVEATGTLEFVQTDPGDTEWFSNYDYDYDYDYDYEGGRWIARDASNEPPFSAIIKLPLVGWAPRFNAVNEVVALMLDFDGREVTLETVQGEVTT